MDFLGYAAQRLWWGLRHEGRRLRETLHTELKPDDLPCGEDEAGILDRIVAGKLLAGLSGEDAALLRLRYVEGHSHRELATITDLSQAAVRKRIQRLRDRIRAQVAEA